MIPLGVAEYDFHGTGKVPFQLGTTPELELEIDIDKFLESCVFELLENY
jgi:hypothetical protein